MTSMMPETDQHISETTHYDGMSTATATAVLHHAWCNWTVEGNLEGAAHTCLRTVLASFDTDTGAGLRTFEDRPRPIVWAGAVDVDLTPDEARKLAAALVEMAALADLDTLTA